MISYETFCKIQDYHQHRGLTVTQIARELGLDPKTVGKWVQAKHYHPRAASERSSKLDPFKRRVIGLLETCLPIVPPRSFITFGKKATAAAFPSSRIMCARSVLCVNLPF